MCFPWISRDLLNHDFMKSSIAREIHGPLQLNAPNQCRSKKKGGGGRLPPLCITAATFGFTSGCSPPPPLHCQLVCVGGPKTISFREPPKNVGRSHQQPPQVQYASMDKLCLCLPQNKNVPRLVAHT